MFLDQILRASQERAQALSRERGALLSTRFDVPTRSLQAALTRVPFAVIAECKRRSPSKGWLMENPEAYDPVAIAERYQENGADSISVLTEPEFFAGELRHLQAVRERIDIPVMRKDFLWDPLQVFEARRSGADAILLIVRILPDLARFRELMAAARDLAMDVLVEAHSEAEVGTALEVGAQILGVNNRDLDSFETRIELSERVARMLPRDVVAISESGIQQVADVERIRRWGYRGVLIGEAFMRGGALLKAIQSWRSA